MLSKEPVLQSEPARFRPTVAEINLTHLRSNFLFLQKLAGPVFFCPMVKANAYGHGDIQVSRTLEKAGAKAIGVALIEEGIRLRQAGIQIQILYFGPFDEAGARAILEYRLTPVLGDFAQLKAMKSALDSSSEKQIVHIKFNTGMSRLGFAVEDAIELKEQLKSTPQLSVVGICTHLASGEDAGLPGGATERQLQKMVQIRKVFSEPEIQWHVANSSGLMNIRTRQRSNLELSLLLDTPIGARPGIALYGAKPDAQAGQIRLENDESGLRPVMSLKSKISVRQKVAVGDGVSYGSTWRAKKPSVVGVVPMGYADGYSRLLSNRGSVLCRGRRAPIVGNVCMDYFMIDLTEIEAEHGATSPGTEVVLIGTQGTESILVEELAKLTGTISYEILSRIGERVPRQFVETNT